MAPYTKYLGAFIGTAVDGKLWAAPTLKWLDRSKAIAEQSAPPATAARLYNARAVTTLTYVAQLALPDHRTLEHERKAICWVLHVPGNTYATKDIFSFGMWNSPVFRSVLITSVAAFVRQAISFRALIEENYSMLATLEYVPLS